jgi:hypothetical protein
MAASISTTATTLEGQIFELCRELQELELAVPADTRPDNITIAPDIEALQVAITLTLPITLGGSGANIVMTAASYL